MTDETAPPFDLLIRGGTVIDGTRGQRFGADVGVRSGRIAAAGDLRAHAAQRTIDATGKIVAPGPGFIDSHTHDDRAVLADPDMVCKISQGVTTVVTGNCGISLAPLKPGAPRPMPLGLIAAEDDPAGAFERFADYMAALRNTPAAVNVAPMVGHTTLRVTAMSALDRAADPDEIAAMQSRTSVNRSSLCR